MHSKDKGHYHGFRHFTSCSPICWFFHTENKIFWVGTKRLYCFFLDFRAHISVWHTKKGHEHREGGWFPKKKYLKIKRIITVSSHCIGKEDGCHS